MYLDSFSNWLERATQPQHPYYHPIQLSLFAGISYLSTACLTNIPPKQGMSVMVLAYTISQLLTPFFIECFEPYQEVSLAPLVGQMMQLTLSFILAKIICNLAGQALSFKEVRLIGLAFFIALFVSRFILLKFRHFLQKVGQA